MAADVNLRWGFINTQQTMEAIINPLLKIARKDFITKDLLSMLRTINRGLLQGQSIAEMSRSIRKNFKISINKANEIARTESHRITEAGHVTEFLKSHKLGIDSKLQLVSTLDGRTRPQSAHMDGQLSNQEGKFEYPNGRWYFVGQTGNGAWDINDRERSSEIIDGFSPQLRRTKEEGVISNKTFKEWAKEKKLKSSVYTPTKADVAFDK